MKNTKQNHPKQAEKQPFPTFGSMQACAGALDVPVASLRRHKAAGCRAFQANNRVATRELLAFLLRRGADSGTMSLDQARTELMKARTHLIQKKAELEIGETIPIAWSMRCMSEAMESIRACVESGKKNFLLTAQGAAVADQEELELQLGFQMEKIFASIQHAVEAYRSDMVKGVNEESVGVLATCSTAMNEVRKSLEALSDEWESKVPEDIKPMIRELCQRACDTLDQGSEGLQPKTEPKAA